MGCEGSKCVYSPSVRGFGVAPRRGFEPQFTAPKAAVLPLDDRGMASRRDNPSSVPVCSPLPQRPSPPRPPPLAATMRNGRQSGLVFGAVFKTVRRLLKSLVCSIRTVFRHPSLNFPISPLFVRSLTLLYLDC